MGMGAHPDHPFSMATALFGSVLAVTLAKAFAEVMAAELGRKTSPMGWSDAWHHARPTLVTANIPTLLIFASGLGLLATENAIALSQGFAVLLLLVLGARVGWVARGSIRATMLAALFTGGIGLALAGMKYVLH
jgi:hypothetical protein